jgi:hypothetical protein
MKNRLLLALVAALALAVFALRANFQAAAPAPEVGPAPPSSFERPAQRTLDPKPPPTSAKTDAAAPPESGRTALAYSASPIQGFVVDEEGNPIADCEVTLTGLTEAQALALRAGVELETALIAAQSRTTQSAVSGHFQLPAPATTGCLWITHPGFAARGKVVSADALDLGQIRLEPQEPLPITVTEARLPAGEAWVVHRAFSSSETLLAGTFLRRARTDPVGRLALPPTGWREELWAQKGKRRSSIWRGPPGPEVDLQLRPTLALSGHVLFEARPPLGPNFGHVLVSLEGKAGRHLTEDLPVDATGAFGPIDIPAIENTDLIVRLESKGFTTVEVRVEGAAPNGAREVQLVTHPTQAVTIDVGKWDAPEDEEWRVPGAEVIMSWTDPQGHRIETRSTSDAKGMATFHDLPDGRVWPRAEATGCVTFETEPIELPWTGDRNPVVWVMSGGHLEGHCLRDGQPVRDFDILAWDSGSGQLHADLAVRDSEDGHFESDRAPLGPVSIVAIGLDGARSEEAAIEVTADGSKAVELHLFAPGTVRGKVLSATSGEALAQARVTPLTSVGDNNVSVGSRRSDLGASYAVNADGSFAVACLGRGTNVLRISAPGFTPETRRFDVGSSSTFELGTIHLRARGTLVLEVTLPKNTSSDRYTAYFAGPEVLPPQSLSRSGAARIEGVAAGPWNVYVFDNVTGTQWFKTRWVPPDGECRILYDLASGCTLEVQLEAPPDTTLTADFLVRFDGFDAEGDSLTLLGTPDKNLHCTFGGVGPGPSRLFGVSNTSAPFTAAYLQIDEADQTRSVDLELSWEPTNVQVVDPEGEPVLGARVCLLGERPSTDWGYARLTDSDGRCTFFGVSDVFTQVVLFGPTGERVEGLAQTLVSGESNQNTLVLDAPGRLWFRFESEGAPALDVEAFLLSPTRLTSLGPLLRPEPDGTLRVDSLNEAPYFLRVEGPGIWPIDYAFTPAAEFPLTQVQVFRSLDCTLEVRTAEGLPAVGVQLELTHLEIESAPGVTCEAQVSGWLASGNASTSPTELTTDSQGRISLFSIPAGTYRWTAEGEGSGSVELTTKAATIFLP